MTREEAIKKLEETVGAYLLSGRADDTTCGEWREILETLKQGPKWIPTSEREPEEYGEYYITWTTPAFDHPLIAICEGEVTWEWDDEKNRWKFEWLLEDYIKAYPDVKVTAWMPLIEAYKEGSRDGT